jgi:hypothetical protein
MPEGDRKLYLLTQALMEAMVRAAKQEILVLSPYKIGTNIPVSWCIPTCVCCTGAQPPEGERKLYLLIEAPTEAMVRKAKQEIRRVIEELVEKAMRRDVGAGARRYQI